MTPEEIEICQRGLRSIINSYGRLVVKDPSGYVVDSGSAICLELDKAGKRGGEYEKVCYFESEPI